MFIFRFSFITVFANIGVLVRSDGMAKLTSHSVIITKLTNLILDLIFIGPMKMGLECAALATVLSDVIGIIYLIAGYFTAIQTSKCFQRRYITILNSQL